MTDIQIILFCLAIYGVEAYITVFLYGMTGGIFSGAGKWPIILLPLFWCVLIFCVVLAAIIYWGAYCLEKLERRFPKFVTRLRRVMWLLSLLFRPYKLGEICLDRFLLKKKKAT